jgi:hypothetical protein
MLATVFINEILWGKLAQGKCELLSQNYYNIGRSLLFPGANTLAYFFERRMRKGLITFG